MTCNVVITPLQVFYFEIRDRKSDISNWSLTRFTSVSAPTIFSKQSHCTLQPLLSSARLPCYSPLFEGGVFCPWREAPRNKHDSDLLSALLGWLSCQLNFVGMDPASRYQVVSVDHRRSKHRLIARPAPHRKQGLAITKSLLQIAAWKQWNIRHRADIKAPVLFLLLYCLCLFFSCFDSSPSITHFRIG